MEWKHRYILGIIIGLAIIVLDVLYLRGERFFIPVIILGICISWLQVWVDFFTNQRTEKERELQFLEFIRAVVESVKSGISIPRSIQQAATKDYGSLTRYIKKLSNQISWGIPTQKALSTFAEDANNPVIKRSIAIMIEAEQSGGDIRDILSSVVQSVVNIKKMKEERKTAVFAQVIQGYIVFYIFIAIMLFIQLWLFPKLTSLSGGFSASAAPPLELGGIFFSMILIQGFFAGIMIGKFSEGTVKSGLLHSLIFMVSGALILSVFGVI